MAGFNFFFICKLAVIVATLVPIHAQAQLSPNFYNQLCPDALLTIRAITRLALLQEPRMGASLLRLHFHDCFVNGCDGSILLDDTPNFTGEKTALPNLNSARGFNVVDDIKTAVDAACGPNVVSCADILAVAARDSVNLLLANFQSQGLDLKDLVVLSAAHTIGLARCVVFRDRIYNDSNIDVNFATLRKQNCPMSREDNNTAPLDATPTQFDTQYFKDLLQFRGLLHSDQELFTGNNGTSADALVLYYSNNPPAFFVDFGASMIKMGNLHPLTGTNGEIRRNCRRVN
ncbi:hypothetical protein CRYUN_Cryun03dG0180400 [Craigia yunnanensis]